MDSAIRTRDLRKIYHTPPPAAAAGRTGFFSQSGGGGKKSKDKPEITALDGIDLESAPGGRFSACSAPTALENRPLSEF